MRSLHLPDWSTLPRWDETRVVRLDDVDLSVAPHTWPLVVDEAGAIEECWARALARNPSYFNGCIHLMRGGELSASRLKADLFPADFKSYLYWRESGFTDHSVRDAFGSGLIRSREGHVILGRQREGNVNSGLTYLPGGFIDGRDVVADAATGRQSIAISKSILREVEEETGLKPDELDMTPGFYVTFTGPQISLAREVVSKETSADLKTKIMSFVTRDPMSELTDIIVVRGRSDFEDLAMPPYAKALLSALFP